MSENDFEGVSVLVLGRLMSLNPPSPNVTSFTPSDEMLYAVILCFLDTIFI